MKVNTALNSQDLHDLHAVYVKGPKSNGPGDNEAAGRENPMLEKPLSAYSLRTGVVPTTTMSLRPALLSLSEIPGNPVSARDLLHLKTDAALTLLKDNQSVMAFVEESIQRLPDEGKSAFSCNSLDHNLCRLKGLYGDMQRPEIVGKVGDYAAYKKAVAQNVELLAKDCRDYVADEVPKGQTMQSGLSPAQYQTVQAFNHLRRVMSSVFQLPIEDGEVYLDAKPEVTSSVDDADTAGLNKEYGAISYSGTHRSFYMKYMPYYLLTMNGPMFLNALSRPRQLTAITTRPGPLKLPAKVAANHGVPEGVPVRYHSVSRYGETNQRQQPNTKQAGPPMKFYYSYEQNGVTRVVELSRRESFYVQLSNRPSMEMPADTIGNRDPLQAKYVMCERKARRLDNGGFEVTNAYIYDAGRERYRLTQAQHQKILQHNAKKADMSDPNGPVHLTHMADGSLDTVMNRIFNDLATRSVSGKNHLIDLFPKGRRDRLKLMKELSEQLRPAFEREQMRVEQLRAGMFQEFADGHRSKDTIEEACRQEAKASFRGLVQERRLAVPVQQSLALLRDSVATINQKFDKMYKEKSDEFATAGAARALYSKSVEPFSSLFRAAMAKNRGFPNINAIVNGVSEADHAVFDATVLAVHQEMEAPGGLRDTLKATYWGGVTQHLMDLNYGPEGIYKDGVYLGREGLPKNGATFVSYLEQNAPELLSDPVQIANRLSKTFANFEYNVSPNFTLPWPNLYRKNDLLRSTGQANHVRDAKTIKEDESDVSISVWVPLMLPSGEVQPTSVRLTGLNVRDSSRQRQAKSQVSQPVAPSVPQREPSMSMS